MGVAQWNCDVNGTCYRLCGKEGFELKTTFGEGRCTYVKPGPTPAPVEGWRRTEDQHCGGTNINTWSDGSSSNYGAVGKSVAGCQATCDAHPECKGFVFRLFSNACYWKTGTFALHENLAHDCYERDVPTPVASTPAPLAPVVAYKLYTGMYCSTYNTYGNACQATTYAEAEQKCDDNTECMGVAQWNCSIDGDCWRLCGKEGFELKTTFGEGRCTYVKPGPTPAPVETTPSPTESPTPAPASTDCSTKAFYKELCKNAFTKKDCSSRGCGWNKKKNACFARKSIKCKKITHKINGDLYCKCLKFCKSPKSKKGKGKNSKCSGKGKLK